MNAHEIIELIISRHEDGSSDSIPIYGKLELEPTLNYSGKMARKAYWGFSRKPFHEGRLHCGILDFKIMNNSGKMEHFGLVERILSTLKIDWIREVYNEGDPLTIQGIKDSELVLLSEVQCAFLEQEVNWGPHGFQLRTFFGLDTIEDELLRNSVPRDFFMVFIEKCFAVLDAGGSIEDALMAIDNHYERSEVAEKLVLKPPKAGSGKKTRLIDQYRKHVYRNNGDISVPWIDSHLLRINQLCEKKGTSPHWNRTYSNE